MSTRGIVARGKPAYDDATEIYGRSAHPFGLRPKDKAEAAFANLVEGPCPLQGRMQ